MSGISARCLAEVNVESLAVLSGIVRLCSIKVDPESEGEEPGADGAGRGLTRGVAQQSSTEST